MLAGEHILHGEVAPFPPFLTAMENAEDAAEMWQEIGPVGVAMLLILVVAWGIGVLIADYVKYLEHKKNNKAEEVK